MLIAILSLSIIGLNSVLFINHSSTNLSSNSGRNYFFISLPFINFFAFFFFQYSPIFISILTKFFFLSSLGKLIQTNTIKIRYYLQITSKFARNYSGLFNFEVKLISNHNYPNKLCKISFYPLTTNFIFLTF